jgi:hypothetical protein
MGVALHWSVERVAHTHCFLDIRNFNWVTRASPKNTRRKRVVAEPVTRNPGEKDVTTANKYVTQMLAVSLGLKLCDAGRRYEVHRDFSSIGFHFASIS